MHEIVQTRIRYGYPRVHILLKREGWAVGKNLVYRLYREEGLALRSKRPRRRKMAVHRETRHRPKQLNEAWRECQNFCVRSRVDHHAVTNRSSNMMAN